MSARWPISGARMLAGGAIAAVAVLAVTGAVAADWSAPTRQPVSVLAQPAAAAASATCTGALIAPGRNSLDANELAIAAQAQAVGTGDESVLDSPIEGRTIVFSGAADAVAGAQSAVVRAEDLTGFTASVCPVPRFQSWLAAGSTTTGSADLLILSNPGAVAATVDLSVFGTDGLVAAPGSTGIVLAAGTQQILPLSGLLVGERSPVVRVTSSGAPIVAALQSSQTQTLEPVGVDVLTGAAEADVLQVIPGVEVPAAVAAGSAALDVRLLAPDADTRATVSAYAVGSAPDSTAAATAEVALSAGLTLEASFPTLTPGTYVVRVDADAPVVAAARTASAAPRDFAWYAPTSLLEVPALVPVAPGASARLVVDTSAEADVDVTLESVVGGPALTLTVPAGSSGAVALPGAGVWRLSATAPVRAGVTYTGAGILAGTPVQPAADEAAALRVYP